MQQSAPNYYATLGLDHKCSDEQIRAAYRLLAKQLHPDVNPNTADALSKTQQLNAAYEVLSNPERRRDYDEAQKRAGTARRPASGKAAINRNITHDVSLRIEECLKGAKLDIRIHDPGNPNGLEVYELIVPPETAPGTRFRIPRTGHFEGGFIIVRACVRPDFRFKPRGTDLRCDLRISAQRAREGGVEYVPGVNGRVRVQIPRNVGRGESIRITGEGLPKARGGRGDLLVRVMYKPEIRIARRNSRSGN